MKGKSFIHEKSIKDIAILSAMRCYGIVGLAPVNVVQRVQKVLGWSEASRGVEVTFKGNRILITFHVILSKGINVKEVVHNLIDQTEYSFEKMVGIKPEISVIVEGIKEE
ncbi:MAG TPA: Asp23/Gls24 family envelope stress response protein [Caldisericia bacterium]|nr:Asp23/Gls24 family envelope stress response protein [Caldisericia bacterium]HON82562.1 Asp23/Gls24 family envelope stress response protein [Caldisericia bacterium]HPC56566.1 Asp23/Gls24 family envelope stress response protein [Caldisericia bacterium]HPP43360.1 Asp23/Gls24 family envelope stress response protein [Caldisericia bacterium]HRT36948.1 Asp23/Gls24 family envelope stress response protein [Caldisericia bacterium]